MNRMPSGCLRQRILVVHAALCALVIRAALRTGSLPFSLRAARVAGALCRTRATPRECVMAGAAAANRLAHATCLYRALTAYALLVRRHPGAGFHVGAARAAALAAHAWVTVDGRPLDDEADRYATLWTAPAEA